MAVGGSSSGSLPEMVSSIFGIFMAFKIASLVFTMVTRKDVITAILSIPVSYAVLRGCISTQVNITQTLTLSVGMVMMKGLWGTTEAIKEFGEILMAPPPSQEQAAPQPNRAQRRAALASAKKKGKLA